MKWALKLDGHDSDLKDWKAFLPAPFDPHVEMVDLPDGRGGTMKAFLLKARSFDPCITTQEVREVAIPMMRSLSALAAVYNGTSSVRFDTVVQVMPDGTFRRHISIQASGGMMRMRGSAVAVAVGGPPPTPQETFVQKANAIASGDLRAALEHFERADNWHDLYKAFEAIEDHVGDREKMRALGVTRRDINDFALSAQLARHHRPNGAPSRVFTLSEGREFIAKLIRACFS